MRQVRIRYGGKGVMVPPDDVLLADGDAAVATPGSIG
jgi:regulator of RNase E activity RraA